MRERLSEVSGNELALVKALGDALSRFDDKLLQDVRRVTADHEARRGAILHELQALASSIGAFPALPEPAPALHELEHELQPYAPANGAETPYTGGDWRQAASNIQDELGLHLNGHMNGRANSH
jgi:hypothetical protein